MKHILSFLICLVLITSVSAQFTGTDSLRNFNNRFIDNNASKAFTNLRLHNLLAGIIDFIDSANGGGSIALGVDTMFITADSVFTYKKKGVFRSFVIRGNPGAGDIYEIPHSDGFGRFANDSNFTYDKSQGLDAGRLIVGPTAIQDGGLSKINSTSDNMNALALTSFGTGINTIVFRRALGTVGLPLALTAGKDLWNFSGRGYTGTAFTQSKAAIYAQTSQDWTDSTTGTRLYFATTQNDSSIMKVRMLIDADGSVGINDTTPEYGLTVNRSMAINKDSVPIVGSATSESVLLIDTVNWRVKRINLLAVDKNIAEDDLSANANHTHNFHGFDQFLDSLGDFYVFSKGQKFGAIQSVNFALLADQTTPLLIRSAQMKTNLITDSISNIIQVGPANREFNMRSSDVGSGANTQINFKIPATGISRIEILSDTIQLSSGQILLNEYTPASAYVKIDTTTVKPLAIDAYGNVWRFGGWPGSSTTSPGGSDTHVQFNNSGAFGGSNKMTWDNSGNVFTVTGDGTTDNGYIYVLNPDGEASFTYSNFIVSTNTTGESPSFQAQNNLSKSINITMTANNGQATIVTNDSLTVSAAHKTQIEAARILLVASDSLRVRAPGQASADSLFASVNYQNVGGVATSKVVKIPFPQSFAQTATATVSATGTETTLISSGSGSLVIPSGDWVIGKTYEVKIHGYLDTDGSNPAQFNFRLKLGSTTIAATGNMNQGAGVSDRTFEAVLTFTARTVSSTGTIFTMGHFINDNDGINKFDNGTSTSTLDMTGSLTLGLTVQMTDGSAGNNANVSVLTFRAIN